MRLLWCCGTQVSVLLVSIIIIIISEYYYYNYDFYYGYFGTTHDKSHGRDASTSNFYRENFYGVHILHELHEFNMVGLISNSLEKRRARINEKDSTGERKG